MTGRYWVISALVVISIYVALVLFLGFTGPMAVTINFFRVFVAFAVLMLYMPAISVIFRTVPPPGRDYLIAGIMLSWLSSFTFALWNEAGRIWHVDTSIFSSPIAGFFSFLLVIGGFFHLQAPFVGNYRKKIITIAAGIVVAVAVVLIAPLFRTPKPPVIKYIVVPEIKYVPDINQGD